MTARRLLLSALLAACAPSFESAVAEHRAAIEAQTAHLAAIAAHATSAPAITAPQPLTLDPPPRRSQYAPDATDTLERILLGDLVALPELGGTLGRRRGPTRLARCASQVRSGREPYDPARAPERLCGERAEILFEACAALRYLAVVRIHALVEPRERDCKAEPGCAPGYHIGTAHGDVLIYRLATGEYLGGAPFLAETSAYIGHGANSSSALLDDLFAAIDSAADRTLNQNTDLEASR